LLEWQLSFNSKGWTLDTIHVRLGCPRMCCNTNGVKNFSQISLFYTSPLYSTSMLPPNKCSPPPFENNLPPQKYCALVMYIHNEYMSHIFLKLSCKYLKMFLECSGRSKVYNYSTKTNSDASYLPR